MHSEDVVYLVGTECRECSTIFYIYIHYRFKKYASDAKYTKINELQIDFM